MFYLKVLKTTEKMPSCEENRERKTAEEVETQLKDRVLMSPFLPN